ncbi:MAG: hypothetical protein WBA16_08410 [Nonlabens sp.]
MYRILLIGIMLQQVIGCQSSLPQNEPTHPSTNKTTANFRFFEVAKLDSKYTETSGLEYLNHQLITHNDSGDAPTIYVLDTLGAGMSQNTFLNMRAIDWEDITRDETHLYIADIGNNYGDRKDLVIYKTPLNQFNNTTAQVERLVINYPEQKDFSRNEQKHPYDAESLVAINKSLYIFSKDWKDLNTIVYKLDKDSVEQSAAMIQKHPIKGLITGATYNGKDAVMLCGYDSGLAPFVIRVNYTEGKFEFKNKQWLPISGGAQVEAITYAYTNAAAEEIYYLSAEAVNIKLGEDEAKSDATLYKMIWKEDK